MAKETSAAQNRCPMRIDVVTRYNTMVKLSKVLSCSKALERPLRDSFAFTVLCVALGGRTVLKWEPGTSPPRQVILNELNLNVY